MPFKQNTDQNENFYRLKCTQMPFKQNTDQNENFYRLKCKMYYRLKNEKKIIKAKENKCKQKLWFHHVSIHSIFLQLQLLFSAFLYF